MPLIDTSSSLIPTRAGARDRLLAAALAALASDAPVAISLDEIRRRAGVSVGALYHHFPDKAALLDALYLDLTRTMQEQFIAELRRHASAREGIEAIVRWYLRWIAAHRVEAAVLLDHRPRDPRLRDLNRAFFGDVMSWWDTHAQYGTLRALPRDVIHALWLGPAQEYARHLLAGHVKAIPPRVAGVLADAAWHSLKETA